MAQCPECKTMMNPEAPYCDSCGCAFQAAKVPRDFKVFIGALATFAIVIVAVALLRSFLG